MIIQGKLSSILHNQRTNVPVTLTRQLVLGRERNFALFHNFKIVYPQRMGIQPLGTNSGSILKLLLFHHFVPVPERSLLHVYIASGELKMYVVAFVGIN